MRAPLLLLVVSLLLQTGIAAGQTCPQGIVDLGQASVQKAPLEIVLDPNQSGPGASGNQVTLGYTGCLRFNPGVATTKYYTGQVQLLFFDNSHNFLTAAGKPLWQSSATAPPTAIPVQNPAAGHTDGFRLNASSPLSYKSKPNAMSPLSVIEIQITQCETADLGSCDAATTATWLWSGQYFVPGPAPLASIDTETVGSVGGVFSVAGKTLPCGAAQPHEGAAFTQATMVATDNAAPASGPSSSGSPTMQGLAPGSTTISIVGCLRFHMSHPEPGRKTPFPFYGLGDVAALLFDSQGNVLTPIGYNPGKPYGQFISIFPAESAVGIDGGALTPILNPAGAGIHAFGFEYQFPVIAHGNISPYATLLLTVRGCSANATSSCTGEVRTFVQTVRTCFAEVRRPAPHDDKPTHCPDAE